jgi:ATP-binding cassette, subfamily B, bacterial
MIGAYLAPLWKPMMALTLLIFAAIGLQLVGPSVLGTFIDAMQADVPVRRLLAHGANFLAVAIIGQGATLGSTYLAETVGWRATNALRADLTRHCLDLDLGFHKAHTPGGLIERIDGDVTTLANVFSQMMVMVIGNGLLAAGVLVMLWALNWRVGLIGVVYVTLTIIAPRALRQRTVEAWRASREAAAHLFGYLGEYLFGTEDVRASGAEGYVIDGLDRRMATVSQRWITAQVRRSLQRNLAALSFVLAEALAIGIAAHLALRGEMTLGSVYAVAAYIALIRSPIDRIQREIGDFQRGSASLARVRTLLETTSRLKPPPDRPKALPEGALSVTLQEVSFRYEDTAVSGEAATGSEITRLDNVDTQVLKAVSLRLEPGQTLGFLGRTGSGKTTLSRLVFRLHDPTAGELLIGGVPAQEVPLDELRRRISLVTQDVQIFQATVRDNLTLFDAGIEDAQLLDAIDMLGLTPWLGALPQGLDTELRAGGQGLSAGQAQLLALARAFLKQPDLCILDEASARLDPVTERLLDTALTRLITGKTAIIIAHRLSTLQRVDTIAILDDGRVIEYGDRRALAADPDSRFSQLLRESPQEALA